MVEKYELLANVVNSETVEESLKLLHECQKYRDDDVFESLYLAVLIYVTERRFRDGRKGEKDE